MPSKFTPRQFAYVRRYYPDLGSAHCAAKLGLRRTQIHGLAKRVGVRLSELGWGRAYIGRVEAYRKWLNGERDEECDIPPDELERRKAKVRGDRHKETEHGQDLSPREC